MVVLYPDGVVGKVQRAGVGGAQVRLVTDPGFRLLVAFGTFGILSRTARAADFIRRQAPTTVVEGAGRGAMVVRGLTRQQVASAKIAEGDLVVVDDREWLDALQGLPLGKVTRIGNRREAPLYAEVRMEPQRACCDSAR